MDTQTEHCDGEPSGQAATGAGSARRRFLKGSSLALPAVVALHSGAARAATSLRCGGEGNVPQTGYDVLVANDHEDERLRAAVELMKQVTPPQGDEDPSDPSNWAINRDDGGSYFQGLKEGDPDPAWRRLDGSLVDGDELQALGYFLTNNSDELRTGTTRYAIVHVNTSDGAVTAIGSPEAVQDSIVTSWTGACMASLYGVAPA